MRRKLLTFLVTLVLLVAQFAVFVPCVYAQSTVATSTNRYSVSFPFQRKGFYAATRFWAFYGNNYEVYYESTTDPTVWSGSATDKGVCLYGYDFSIFFDGTYVHCVWYYLYDLIYDRGTPYSNGTIIWTDSSYAYDGIAGFYYNYPCITVDSNGYAWIGARFYNSTVGNRYPYVLKNAHNDGSWVTDFSYQLSATATTTWYVQPVALTSGKVYVIYCSEAALPNGKLYSGSWGSEETDLADYNNNYYGYMFCAVNEGDNVHFTYNRQTTYQIRYNKRTYGVGWGANDVLVNDTMESFSVPALTIDTTTGDLYCFWTRIDTDHVYYKKCTSGTWDASPTDWIDESTDDIQYGYMLNSYYQTYGGYTGLLYVTGLASLYNVRFDYLTMAVSKAWYDVSTWTASLVTKTWSSGTSWAANLLTRTWSSGTLFNFNLHTRIWSSVAFLGGIATELIDSYDESHCNSDAYMVRLHPSNMTVSSAEGQSFTMLSSDHTITSCKFYLKKLNNPTGMAHAVLYAHQGIYGTNSTPIGDALATSDDFDVSTLTTSYQLVTFTFNSSQQYLMKANTYYCIAFENPMSGTINYYNCPIMGFDYGSPTHSGSNFLYFNSTYFPAFTSFDTIFYVYGKQTTGGISLLTRQYITIASWLFDFGTKIWTDAATWTYNLVTMAWQNIAWIFYLGTSIWTDIATWVFYPFTRLWNDIAVWAFNVTAMMWRDLSWLFYLFPRLPEWVNVAVWIFHLVPAEWIFPFIWIIMAGFIGLCCLVVSAKPQKKRETENV